MEPETIGLIGGIAGGALGTLGGLLGAYFSIKHTNGPRERAFMIWMSVACWAALVAFLAALWFMPFPYRTLLWLPYVPLLFWAARSGNRRLEQIRREEMLDVGPDPEPYGSRD